MNTSPVNNRHPQFGWNSKKLINLDGAAGGAKLFFDSTGSLPEDLISPAVLRPAGFRRVGICGIVANGDWVPAGPSDNKVNLILEGSNDGLESTSGLVPRNINDHWQTIAELDIDQFFDGSVFIGALGQQTRLLGTIVTLGTLIGDPNVDVNRYQYIRIRAVVVAIPAPPLQFTMSVIVSGIGADSEKFERNITMLRGLSNGISAAPLYELRYSTPFKRPAGTRWMTVQGVATTATVQAPTLGYGARLQGTFDGFQTTDTWFNVGSIGPGPYPDGWDATGQSLFFQRGQEFLIDMDPFDYFRIVTCEDTAPGVPTANEYTLDFLFSFDGGDVLAKEDVATSDFNPQLAATFYKIQFGKPEAQVGAGVGATIDVPFQVLGIDALPVRQIRELMFTLATNANDAGAVPQGRYFDGILSPEADYSISAVAPLTSLARLDAGYRAIVVQTDDTGAGVLRVTQNIAGPGTTWIWPETYPGIIRGLTSLEPGYVLIASGDAEGTSGFPNLPRRGQRVLFV